MSNSCIINSSSSNYSGIFMVVIHFRCGKRNVVRSRKESTRDLLQLTRVHARLRSQTYAPLSIKQLS